MAKLDRDALKVPECADALTSNWENEDMNCRCWDAMGQEYREANFYCLTHAGISMTIMDIYEHECLEAKESKMDVGKEINDNQFLYFSLFISDIFQPKRYLKFVKVV